MFRLLEVCQKKCARGSKRHKPKYREDRARLIKIQISLLLFFRARNIRKIRPLGIFFPHVMRDIIQRFKFGSRFGFENDFISLLFDGDFRAFKAKGLRQAHGLTASVLEELGCNHSYNVYLHLETSSGEIFGALEEKRIHFYMTLFNKLLLKRLCALDFP